MKDSSGKHIKYLLPPLCIAFLGNFNVLFNQFVWDDHIFLAEQLPVFKTFKDIFFPDMGITQIGTNYYRPLIVLTYLLDFHLWGKNPMGFHLTVFLFHLGNTVMVYFLSRALLKHRSQGPAIAAVAASLFAVHPIHTENVAWMAGRTDTVSAFFMFGAMFFYIRFLTKQKAPTAALLLSSTCLFLALLSKEVALSLLILIPAYHFLEFFSADDAGKKRLKVTFPNVLIPGSAFLLYYGLRQAALGTYTAATEWGPQTGGTVILTFIASVGFYLKKLFWPSPLQAFIPEIPSSTAHLILSVLLILFWAFLFILGFWKKRTVVSFSVVWVMITLAPSLLIAVSSVSKTPLAERYLYIPSFGLCLLAGLLIIGFLNALQVRFKIPKTVKPILVWILAGIIVVPWGWSTFKRNRIWSNNITFWSDLVQKIPHSGLPHNNLGQALQIEGRLEEAAEEFKLAHQLYEDGFGRSLAGASLGNLYRLKGNFDLAERYLTQSIKENSRNHLAYYFLGNLLMDRAEREKEIGGNGEKHLEQAEFFLKKAIENSRYFPESHYDLGLVYLRMGKIKEARKRFRTVIEISLDPNTPVVRNAKKLLASPSLDALSGKKR